MGTFWERALTLLLPVGLAALILTVYGVAATAGCAMIALAILGLL